VVAGPLERGDVVGRHRGRVVVLPAHLQQIGFVVHAAHHQLRDAERQSCER